MTDIDHVLPASTAQALIYGQHDPKVVYAFSRIEHTGEKVNPHSASFLMTKKMFWKIGGYDEELSGHYGTDGDYRRRLATKAGIEGHRFRIHAPLLAMTKAEIVRRGIQLGVDFGLTHSCYDPGPSGRPCGHCDSCVLRAKGFDEAGLADPVR